jgi:thiol peroxidase
MAEITLKQNPIHTSGTLPPVGSPAPEFILTKTDLTDITLKDFAGKKTVLSIFPSIDTLVCAMSVRRFNAEAAGLKNTVVLCVSADLPFAHARFCAAEGLQNVITASELRRKTFGEDYGVRIIDGPLAGLLARAVVIIDEKGKIAYTQLVQEIAQEPDYDEVLRNLK